MRTTEYNETRQKYYTKKETGPSANTKIQFLLKEENG
jgi:hypothetical protein